MMDFDEIAYNSCTKGPEGKAQFPTKVEFKKARNRDSGEAREIFLADVMGYRVWTCEAPCSRVKLRRNKHG